MTKKPSKRLRLLLTDRAVNDTLDIERYSIEQFGKRVANRYLTKLEAALQRISAEPGLLHREPAFHASLRFYRVEKHLLICETGVNGHIFVLTVAHASIDIPSRLSELEPSLALEMSLLFADLKRSNKR